MGLAYQPPRFPLASSNSCGRDRLPVGWWTDPHAVARARG